MRLSLAKVLTLLVVVQLFLFIMFVSFQNISISNAQLEQPIIKVVDSASGSPSVSFGSSSDEMPPSGYKFTVSVVLNGSVSLLYTYQITLAFNKSALRCDAAWIPTNDPSWIFYGKSTVQGSPQIDNVVWGDVLMGSTLITDTANVSQGLFAKANFTVFRTGSFSINVVPTEDPNYGGADSFLMKRNQIAISFTPQSIAVSVTAKPSPPIASFVFTPSNPKANETVAFDASSSFDPVGSVVSYFWDFGDGYNATSALTNTTHVFAQNGVYSVNLTVTNNDGINGSTVEEVPVGSIPVPIFTYDWERKDEFPSYPYMDILVTFNASMSYDRETRTPELPNGNITLYVWNFTHFQFHAEDTVPTYLPVDVSNETATNSTLIYNFTANGVYNVKLTIFNSEGLSNSTVQNIFVGIPPVTNFTCTPQPAMPGEDVLFNAYQNDVGTPLSYDPDGRIVYAVWDFGDVNMSAFNITRLSDLVTTHAYQVQGGVYTANLTVVDDDGLYTSALNEVNITVIRTAEAASSDWQGYAAAGAVFGVVVAATVWYRRRPEKEPNQRDRFRVI